MAKVLVVANRTAECEELQQALTERAAKGDDVTFTLVVPSAHGFAKAAGSDDAGATEQRHVDNAVAKLRDAGLQVEGRLGDPDPVAAVQDAANAGSYDELVVSTLPTHLSKWLHIDLPRKAAHATGLPVTHVVASSAD
ncbi:MAG TPA: hypothetical protein VD790_08615 [Thermoleophilaceae bacterium]|nr:hypothetical protein [Thermoleophilaceae bacterium]